MKVRIDENLCQGHGMCALACPQLFHLSDEDGHAYLEDENVPPQFEQAVERAVRSCPEGAIRAS
jgi:ferredoxin